MINNIIAYITDMVERHRHANLSKTLAAFDTIVSKIDKFTQIASRDLANIQDNIEMLHDARDAKNLELDRAYRTLHNLSQLVK